MKTGAHFMQFKTACQAIFLKALPPQPENMRLLSRSSPRAPLPRGLKHSSTSDIFTWEDPHADFRIPLPPVRPNL